MQTSLWSGTHECISTSGFVRNEVEILTVLTGFFGGGTAFPIHKLRDTYESRDPKRDKSAHILMISDDGIDTMFASDERGNSGWDVSARALSRAGGGGTMALNLWAGHKADWMDRVVNEQGWDIHTVTDFEQLVTFARRAGALVPGCRDGQNRDEGLDHRVAVRRLAIKLFALAAPTMGPRHRRCPAGLIDEDQKLEPEN